MESPLGEDAVKTFGMTGRNLEYYINLSDKAAAGFDKIDWKNCGQNAMKQHCTLQRNQSRKAGSIMRPTSWLSYFKQLPQLLQPLPAATPVNQRPSTSKQHPPPAKRRQFAESSDGDHGGMGAVMAERPQS
ncbi:tigger transposable element-derived protein 1-like [Manis pentadactyla]|uniref:tigger transposable element-derived protein 1-like n=1 Tax=Manis pentadactyla TaxID=143292 RepID=UPI00255CEBE0|nr:tigger transposable element-derived protein 1-like [Manis pentadactyla]